MTPAEPVVLYQYSVAVVLVIIDSLGDISADKIREEPIKIK